MPPFQGWDTTVRTSLAEVQILSVALVVSWAVDVWLSDCKSAEPRGSAFRASLLVRVSQSVLGTAAAHSRARDGSIPSAATNRSNSRVARECDRKRFVRSVSVFAGSPRGAFPLIPPRGPSPAIYIAVLVHSLDSKSGAAGFDPLAVCESSVELVREISGPPCGNRAVG